MKAINRLSILFVILSFVVDVNSQAYIDQVKQKAQEITTGDFEQYMSVLAHDSLEGRKTGTEGIAKAASYIRKNLEDMQITPAGTEGSYLQPVVFNKHSFKEGSPKIKIITAQDTLSPETGKEIASLAPYSYPELNEELPLVFVGNGIIFPEKGINDYANVDVKGKIVIIELSKPKFLKDTASDIFNPFNLIETAIKQGAEGIILYFKIGIFQNIIMKEVSYFLSKPIYTVKGMEVEFPMFDYKAKFFGFAHRDLIEDLLKTEGKKLKKYLRNMEKGIPSSFELEAKISMQYELNIEPVKCNNVVAMIPGSDPHLKDEYVVFTAHLDHEGIGKAVKKDSIYNGAWDNASGSASILSLAKTFNDMDLKPKRSILFVWLTAEEEGLLGSHYFVHNPTVPKENLAAVINLDMPGGFIETRDIVPLGYETSNLAEAVDFAAQELNMTVNQNEKLNEYFDRSDHFSFFKAGIPSIFVWRGQMIVDSKKDGYKEYKKWEKKILHTPFDDLSQDFGHVGFKNGLKINFLIGAYVANEMESIEWNTESEKYKKYVVQ